MAKSVSLAGTPTIKTVRLTSIEATTTMTPPAAAELPGPSEEMERIDSRPEETRGEAERWLTKPPRGAI